MDPHASSRKKRSKPRALVVVTLLAAFAALCLSAAAQARMALVVDQASAELLGFDTRTHAPIGGPLGLGGTPHRIAFSPDGDTAYIPNAARDEVQVVDTGNRGIKTTIPLTPGAVPRDLAVTPDGRRLFVVNSGRDNISVVDTQTNQITSTTRVGIAPRGIAISPRGDQAYVTNSGSDNVSVLDLRTADVTATTSIGSGPRSIAITPRGDYVYAANFGLDTVSVIDAGTNQLVDTLRVGPSPSSISIAPDGKRAYVSHVGFSQLAVIDTDPDSARFNEVVATVPELAQRPGIVPLDVAIAPDGKKAFVSYETASRSEQGNVAVVDTATNQVVDTIGAAGERPVALAIAPNQTPETSLKVTVRKGDWQVDVDASRSRDPDGAIRSFHWDFGDGTTLDGPDVLISHAYELPRASAQRTIRRTVRVVAEDDEGGSKTFVSDGRNIYHNGTDLAEAKVTFDLDADGTSVDIPPATAPIAQPGTSESAITTGACSRSLRDPYLSVTHWQKVDRGVRARLSGAPGGYVRTDQRRARFTLEARAVGGRGEARLKGVGFVLDGKTLSADASSPYYIDVDPRALAPGWHELAAETASRSGETRRRLAIKFLASACDEGAALRASLSSKLTGARPDAALAVTAGDQDLDSVEFGISKNLAVNTKTLAAVRQAAAFSFVTRSGKIVAGPVGLAGSQVRRGADSSKTIVTGALPRTDITGVRLDIHGKRYRALRNPARCNLNHRFSATLHTRQGNTILVSRPLRMCTTPD